MLRVFPFFLLFHAAASFFVSRASLRRLQHEVRKAPSRAALGSGAAIAETSVSRLQHERPNRSFSVVMSTQGGRRVVVTGMGIVSCLGNTLDEVAESLRCGKSGIKVNPHYTEVGMRSQVCGRPDIACEDFIDRKQIRFMGDNCKYAYIAMQRAVEDSGLTPEQIATPRVGGILGQGGTSIVDIADTVDAVRDGKNRRIGPYRVTRSMGSTVSAVISTAFKLQGVSFSISSACSTSAHCIGG